MQQPSFLRLLSFTSSRVNCIHTFFLFFLLRLYLTPKPYNYLHLILYYFFILQKVVNKPTTRLMISGYYNQWTPAPHHGHCKRVVEHNPLHSRGALVTLLTTKTRHYLKVVSFSCDHYILCVRLKCLPTRAVPNFKQDIYCCDLYINTYHFSLSAFHCWT